MNWKPQTYLQFAGPRTRPAADLLARIAKPDPATVIDLGCGTGNSTALLAARWPGAKLTGLDSSEAMLAQARAGDVPADWVLGDIASWQPAFPYDVIFSNAAFQWLGDQVVLLPRLLSFVAKGGVFAFQVPVNYHAHSHALMRDVAAQSRFKAALANVREIQWATASGYYDMLAGPGVSLDIWTTEYLQVLEGEDAVYRWVSATGLRPFVQALAGDEQAGFIAEYKARLDKAYPRRADGSTLLPFQRLFVVAIKN